MKTIYLKYIASALFVVFAMISCSDVVNMNDGWDDDLSADGAPTVRKIAASADTTKVISKATLNQSIAIFGDNLAHVKGIRINDVDVDLSQVYAKRHRLELVIPRVLPKEINNLMIIKTALGEITLPLTVIVPDLKITGFSNDFALDGDTVQVVGADFDLYKIDTLNATAKFNGEDIKIFNCQEKSFSIQIPKGTPQEETSNLTITSPEVSGSISVPFREKGFAILTNDERTWQGGWWESSAESGIKQVGPDSKPAAPMFKWYVLLKETYAKEWGYTNIMVTYFWLDNSATNLLAHPENYYVKMEILNPEKTPLNRYILIGNERLDAEKLLYKWNPLTEEGVSLNSRGKWMTVALEAADVFRGKDGKKTSLIISDKPYMSGDDANKIKMAMNPELPGDVEFYFWNIRFVKKIATK